MDATYQGKKNIYVCGACKGHIVTVDRDAGVTPATVGCRATHGCGGHMWSSMYRVFDQDIGADHEWYTPSAAQVLTPGEREHVSRGGLLLRKLERLS